MSSLDISNDFPESHVNSLALRDLGFQASYPSMDASSYSNSRTRSLVIMDDNSRSPSKGSFAVESSCQLQVMINLPELSF